MSLGLWQKSDWSWQFFQFGNEKIKAVQNDSYWWTWHKISNFRVDIININGQVKGNLDHVVQIGVSRLQYKFL